MGLLDLFRSDEGIIENAFEDAIKYAKENASNEEEFKDLARLNAEVCKTQLQNNASDLPFEKRIKWDMKVEDKYDEVLRDL